MAPSTSLPSSTSLPLPALSFPAATSSQSRPRPQSRPSPPPPFSAPRPRAAPSFAAALLSLFSSAVSPAASAAAPPPPPVLHAKRAAAPGAGATAAGAPVLARKSRVLMPVLFAMPLLLVLLSSRATPLGAAFQRRPVSLSALSAIPALPADPRDNEERGGDDKAAGAKRKADQMSVDFRQRAAAAAKRGREAPQARYIRWLHAPKTGTSFVNTLLRWGCPGLADDFFAAPRLARPADLAFPYPPQVAWDWLFRSANGRSWLRRHCGRRLVRRSLHSSSSSSASSPTNNNNSNDNKRNADDALQYSVDMHAPLRSEQEATVAAGLFRRPAQRTLSNYQHIAYHYNASRVAGQPLRRFLAKPRFRAQQAKLLLGRSYKDRNVVSAAQARRAAQLVTHRLAFVGLTEHFALSVRLFHARFGGTPHRAQFANVRPSLERAGMRLEKGSALLRPDGAYDESALRGWRDEADEIVYAAARQRFWKDVRTWKSKIEADGIGEVVFPANEESK